MIHKTGSCYQLTDRTQYTWCSQHFASFKAERTRAIKLNLKDQTHEIFAFDVFFVFHCSKILWLIFWPMIAYFPLGFKMNLLSRHSVSSRLWYCIDSPVFLSWYHLPPCPDSTFKPDFLSSKPAFPVLLS